MAADFASHIAQIAGALVCLHPGARQQRTAMVWQPGVLVTSCEGLPEGNASAILPGGQHATAQHVTRDPSTNIALFKLELTASALPAPGAAAVGGLAVIVGAADDGTPAARLALVHRVGPAWDSMAGGRIDQLIRLDGRMMSTDEGGPVLDAAGELLGMSTLGPRRRALVIPAATLSRVIGPLLGRGGAARGWLGIGLQPVAIPAGLQPAAGRDSGLMIVSLATDGPAEASGVLPGDILLLLAGKPVSQPRAVAHIVAARPPGEQIILRLLRAGVVTELSATIGTRL